MRPKRPRIWHRYSAIDHQARIITRNFIYSYIFYVFYTYVYIVSLTLKTSKDPHNILTGNVRDHNLHLSWKSISSFYAPSFLQNISTLYIMIILQLISNCTLKRNTIRHYIENSLGSIKQFIEASLLFYVTIMNIILIVICNCSLLNPGPSTTPVKDSNLKVFYQNVHGLLTYSSLGSKNPVLNITKVFEFQSYIANNHPDIHIVVLNETWLKASINDTEIFPNNDYKILRLDRSPDSHPPDPNNSKKSRRNGGGFS